MLKSLKNTGLKFGVVLTSGLLASTSAFASARGPVTANGLDELSGTFIDNTLNLPGLISIVAYMAGLALGVLGVLKLKDHVENPSQTPLKDGAVRLGAGGALLALPFLYEVLINSQTDGNTGVASQVIQLQGLSTARTVG
jgi:hypothetical protein